MFDMWISSGATFSISCANGLKHQKAIDVIYEKKSENKKKPTGVSLYNPSRVSIIVYNTREQIRLSF